MTKVQLPYNEFLLRHVKEIEAKIIEWFKQKYSAQDEDCSVRITKKGKWEVGFSNDYPMQHGPGKKHVLTEEDFEAAMKLNTEFDTTIFFHNTPSPTLNSK